MASRRAHRPAAFVAASSDRPFWPSRLSASRSCRPSRQCATGTARRGSAGCRVVTPAPASAARPAYKSTRLPAPLPPRIELAPGSFRRLPIGLTAETEPHAIPRPPASLSAPSACRVADSAHAGPPRPGYRANRASETTGQIDIQAVAWFGKGEGSVPSWFCSRPWLPR